MFDTWASYESTRAFVTSSFLWQRRGSDFPLLARILPEIMKTTRFLADLPLENVILAKRCHYPQPRPPQTHPPTKATVGSHCASSRRAPSYSFAPNQQKSAGRLISLRFPSLICPGKLPHHLWRRPHVRALSWESPSTPVRKPISPADACPRPRAHLTWEGYRRARTLTLACARRARCWCAASSRPCQCRSHLRGLSRARTSLPRAALRRARRSAESRHPRQASRRPEAP